MAKAPKKSLLCPQKQELTAVSSSTGGRKRNLAVDALGLPIAIHVSAANVHDGQAGIELLWRFDEFSKA